MPMGSFGADSRQRDLCILQITKVRARRTRSGELYFTIYQQLDCTLPVANTIKLNRVPFSLFKSICRRALNLLAIFVQAKNFITIWVV